MTSINYCPDLQKYTVVATLKLNTLSKNRSLSRYFSDFQLLKTAHTGQQACHVSATIYIH